MHRGAERNDGAKRGLAPRAEAVSTGLRYLRKTGEPGLVPLWRHDRPGGAVQVLFEAQLEGLAHGADDPLGEALTALQDVAGWGGFSLRGIRAASAGWHSGAGPRPPHPPDLTSLVDGILGYIGHVIRHVLQRDGGGGVSWTRLGQPGRDAGPQL